MGRNEGWCKWLLPQSRNIQPNTTMHYCPCSPRFCKSTAVAAFLTLWRAWARLAYYEITDSRVALSPTKSNQSGPYKRHRGSRFMLVTQQTWTGQWTASLMLSLSRPHMATAWQTTTTPVMHLGVTPIDM